MWNRMKTWRHAPKMFLGWSFRQLQRGRSLGFIGQSMSNPIPFEFLSGATLVVIGLWLLAPGWDTFGKSVAYEVIRQIASENQWGLFFTGIGLAQLAGLKWGTKLWRTGFALGITGIWFSYGALFALANAASTGIGIFLMFALCSFLAYQGLMKS